jgi:lipopolysaccharide transport system permease protein
MAIGLVWISATICVFFRDLQQAIPIIVLFLMLVSPIGYTDEMVPVDMKAILQVNPLAWLMHLYRYCLIDGVLPAGDLVVFGLLSMVMLSVGHLLITRLKPLFSDYV